MNMNEILQKLIDGEISMGEAGKRLKTMQIREIEDFAKLDMCRDVRTGIPEVIYAEGKINDELLKIIIGSADKGRLMITKLDNDKYNAIKEKLTILKGFKIDYHEKAKILLVKNHEIKIEIKISIP